MAMADHLAVKCRQLCSKNKVMIEAVNYIYGLVGRDFTIKDVKDVFAELEDMIENGKTVEQYQYIRLRG